MNDAKLDKAVEIICKSLHDWWYLTENEDLRSIWRRDVKEALLKAMPLLETTSRDDFLSKERKLHEYIIDRENGTEE